MIVISAALVVAAFGLLVAGITLSQIVLVYASIGVSALAALLLGAGAFQQRHELLGRSAGAASNSEQKAGRRLLPGRKKGAPEPASVGSTGGSGGNPATATATTTSSERPDHTDSNIPGDAPVSVLPARRTYHLPSCRQLRRARETDELTYAEAHEQGYTACTSCLPDTVLAARAGSGSPTPADSDQATDFPDGAAADRPGEAADELPDKAPAPAESRTEDADGTVRAPAGEDGAYGDTMVAPDDAPEGEAGLVGVVRGSHRYHRLTCAVVEDAVQDGIEMSTLGRSEAEAQDCTPCTVCRP